MSNKHRCITGWDIGGAHIKAARCDDNGLLLQVIEIACPVWRGIEQLQQGISRIQSQLNNQLDIAAITMTAELVDLFPDRQHGVQEILAVLSEYIPAERSYVYASDFDWLSPSKAVENWQAVASQNWHASALFASQQLNEGLLVDIGSTTSDIIAFNNGKICTTARNDFDRQTTRELVYTGVIRTPLIALANSAPFEGKQVGLAAEFFATTADCWVLLNKLNNQSIQDESSDGKAWQKQDAQRRIARLLGTDAHHHPEEHWLELAHWFASQQIKLITTGCEQVLSQHLALSSQAPLIGAGIGRFIIEECAQQLGRDYTDFSSLVTPSLSEAADHAPATAVALLASASLT